jgi:hypothetical protein
VPSLTGVAGPGGEGDRFDHAFDAEALDPDGQNQAYSHDLYLQLVCEAPIVLEVTCASQEMMEAKGDGCNSDSAPHQSERRDYVVKVWQLASEAVVDPDPCSWVHVGRTLRCLMRSRAGYAARCGMQWHCVLPCNGFAQISETAWHT